MDPALVDRRSTLVSLPDDRDLPERRMTIAGIEGSVPARILSRDMQGPATRLVRIPAGWGTSAPGGFTADVELFVIAGRLDVAGAAVGPNGYVRVRAGQLIPWLRVEEALTALLFTSQPVRYERATRGELAPPAVFHAETAPWQRREDGRALRPITPADHRPALWLSSAFDWKSTRGWHRHPTAHEWFVLEGEFTIAERDEDGEESVIYRPGGYAYRPPGREHAGPGSHVDDHALAVCRSPAPLTIEWLDQDGGSAAQ